MKHIIITILILFAFGQTVQSQIANENPNKPSELSEKLKKRGTMSLHNKPKRNDSLEIFKRTPVIVVIDDLIDETGVLLDEGYSEWFTQMRHSITSAMCDVMVYPRNGYVMDHFLFYEWWELEGRTPDLILKLNITDVTIADKKQRQLPINYWGVTQSDSIVHAEATQTVQERWCEISGVWRLMDANSCELITSVKETVKFVNSSPFKKMTGDLRTMPRIHKMANSNFQKLKGDSWVLNGALLRFLERSMSRLHNQYILHIIRKREYVASFFN